MDDFGPDFDENGEPLAEGESDRVDSTRAVEPDSAGEEVVDEEATTAA